MISTKPTQQRLCQRQHDSCPATITTATTRHGHRRRSKASESSSDSRLDVYEHDQLDDEGDEDEGADVGLPGQQAEHRRPRRGGRRHRRRRRGRRLRPRRDFKYNRRLSSNFQTYKQTARVRCTKKANPNYNYLIRRLSQGKKRERERATKIPDCEIRAHHQSQFKVGTGRANIILKIIPIHTYHR